MKPGSPKKPSPLSRLNLNDLGMKPGVSQKAYARVKPGGMRQFFVMTNSRCCRFVLSTIGLILLFCAPYFAQRRTTTHPRPLTITITSRSGESLTSVAERSNVAPEELARANGLTVNAHLRRGQRVVIPAATLSPSEPAPQTGEVIGKRIVFADGRTLDVDDTWKQADTVWYRLHGTSQSVDREVTRIENRYNAPATTSATAVAQNVAPKVTAVAPITWIYLADGARLRVDEVREVADGAWYNRGKLTIFLDRERIARIEREQPDAANGDFKDRGWSSGNTSIDQLIRKHASRYAVDPYLVFLVIEQESHFRTHIVSPKGAQGLMQLMPGTARRFGVARPFDAGENIRGGTQYLKELLTMFKGRVDLALASYNAGEGRVLDYGNRVPPFKETRDYVKRISSRYRNHVQEDPRQEVARPRRRQ
jgi:soluble lytic murein transglycosylase-like protein